MNSFVIASLSLIILAEAVCADDPYEYVTECKNNTEICIKLRCSLDQQVPAQVPFTYHYSCCNGKLIDEKNYACVRYKLLVGYQIITTQCDPCTQFRCNDGQCTFKQWQCNGVKDCMDGSDEVGCSSCSKNQFHCKDSDQCIDADRVCDKVRDCPDGLDETGCPKLSGSKCGVGKYRCKNDNCIIGNWVCDGEDDCEDGSDEDDDCPAEKRNEISSLERILFKKNGDSGENVVDVANGTFVV